MYRLCGYHGAHISIRPSIPLSLFCYFTSFSGVSAIFDCDVVHMSAIWYISLFLIQRFCIFWLLSYKTSLYTGFVVLYCSFSCFALTERWQIKIKTWINEWRNLTNEVVSQQGFEGFVNGLNKDDVGHTVHAMTITVTTSQLSERRRSPPPSLKHQIRKYI